MASTTPPSAVLRSVIRVALKAEAIAPTGRVNAVRAFLGFGFLVRSRRLSQAILRLGQKQAYEGRMLLRSMIEIQLNYSWICLLPGRSRATRFLRYQPLEARLIHRDASSILEPSEARRIDQQLRADRTATRHLFRYRDRRGRMQWESNWANGLALRDRAAEIFRAETGFANDLFIYGIYSWASSAIHGGPTSLSEVIETRDAGPRAKRQPEPDPKAQLKAAAAILGGTLTRFAREARLVRALRPDLRTIVGMIRSQK